VISPDIGPDSVTFRLRAPEARAVSLRGQWAPKPIALSRDAEGVWSVAVPGVPAGVWEYSLMVDGVEMIDPGNTAIKPMRAPRTSILHLPANPPAPWDFQDIPHGVVHQHSYVSRALGRPREMVVYTPPGYSPAARDPYPLLVLQHGSGDNHATWVAHGKAHWILDHLIAAKKARPMVVVMLDGHPFTPGELRAAPRREEAFAAFRRELLEDALPLVESKYIVARDAAHRAIAGLSMGGGQSLMIGLGDAEKFGWVASFSGATPQESAEDALVATAAANATGRRLLWIACGRGDFLLTRNEVFVAKLKAAGVPHEWHLTAGGHTWPVWRGYLVEFLPRLFRSP
jgi:enterochelin esterase family protein